MLWYWFIAFLLSCRASTVLQSLQNSKEWWLLQNTSTGNIYAGIESKLIFLRNAHLDTSGIHSCYEYKVYDIFSQLIEKTSTFCYPAVFVSGYKKCSTSALYMLMTQYHGVIRDHGKENCIFGNQGGSTVTGLFDTYPPEITDGGLLVSGCIYWDRNHLMHHALRGPNAFYIMMYRNYADYLWSAYNYWCSFPYDKNCRYENQWVILRKFTRSPEIFHELVDSFARNVSVLAPAVLQDSCNIGASIFTNHTFSLWRSVPPQNTLILSSEEMEANPNVTWDRIASAIGFTRHHKKLSAFEKVRYNVNSAKGAARPTDVSNVKPGLYEISGFRPMFNSSRDIIDKCWLTDCHFVSEATNHSYKACSAVQSTTTTTTAAATVGVKYETVDKNNFNAYRATILNASYVRENNFIKTNSKQCHSYLQNIVMSKQHKATSASTTTTASHSNAGHSKHHSHQMVLLLSTSLVRRVIGRFLMYFLSSTLHVSSVELSEHTSVHSKDLLCINSNSNVNGNGVVIVTAHPDEVAYLSGGSGGFEYANKQSICSEGKSAPIFSKVIVLLDDQNDMLLLAWKLFKQLTGYHNSDQPLHSIARFDWSQWSDNLAKHVKLLDAQKPHLGSEHVWSKSMREAVNRINANNKLLLHMRNIFSDKLNNYANILKQLRAFVSIDSTAEPVATAATSATSASVDMLQCSLLSVVEGISESERSTVRNAFTESIASEAQHLDIVYASSREVCVVEKLFTQQQSLELMSLRKPLHAASYCEANELPTTSTEDGYSVCVSRFKERITLPSDAWSSPAVALIGEESSESIVFRLLLEHSTGVLSGGPDRYCKDCVYIGAVKCGSGVLVNHISPADTLMFPKNATVTTSNSYDQLRCSAKMSFSKVILLVHDPLLAIWSEYTAATTTSLTSTVVPTVEPTRKPKNKSSRQPTAAPTTSTPDKSQGIGALVNLAKNFNTDKLISSNMYARVEHIKFAADNVLVLSYEELIRDTLLSSGNSTSKRYSVMSKVLEFVSWKGADVRRLDCLTHFIPKQSPTFIALVSQLNSLGSAMKEEANIATFCEVQKILREKLKRLSVVSLVDSLDCLSRK